MEQIVERRCPSRSVPPHLYIHAPGDTRSDTGARHVTSPHGRKMRRVHKQNTNQGVLTDRQTDTTTQTRSERERARARVHTRWTTPRNVRESKRFTTRLPTHQIAACHRLLLYVYNPPPPPENTHARHTHTHKWTANQQIGARAKEEKETDKRRTGTIVRANFPRWDTIQRAQDCAWARTHARTHAHTHTHARKHFHRRASGGYSPPACAAPNTPPVEAPEAPPAAG